MKKDVCMNLIDEINKLNEMSHKEFIIDENGNRTINVINEPIPEGIKELAISYISNLAESEFDRYTIYHGQDGVSDFIYYIDFIDGNIRLVRETDYGMKNHQYYNESEEILYGVTELEKLKEKTEEVTVSRK